MNTSYFAKSAKHPNAVSIAGKAPEWYTGREYKILAPKYWFFKKYKEDRDEEFYTTMFFKEVLAPLNPCQVIQDIGLDAVLLCWEKPSDFCHRYLVARWFHETLGIEVAELVV